jgi:hypothetical protein
MAGEKLKDLPKIDRNAIDHIAVKEAVFPFARFPGVDPVLSPEMKSTGEVMGIYDDFATAFAKAQLGAGTVPDTPKYTATNPPKISGRRLGRDSNTLMVDGLDFVSWWRCGGRARARLALGSKARAK